MKKVITLYQPWAMLVILGLKKIETRSWATKHTGELLIHAGQAKNKAGVELYNSQICMNAMKSKGYAHFAFNELPFGKIIGSVTLDRCVEFRNLSDGWNLGNERIWDLTKQERAFGDFTEGRFGWLLSNANAYKKQITVKGKLQLWDFNDELCDMCGHEMITTGFPVYDENFNLLNELNQCKLCYEESLNANES